MYKMELNVLSFQSQTAFTLNLLGKWLELLLICLSHWVRNLESVNNYTLCSILNCICTVEILSVSQKQKHVWPLSCYVNHATLVDIKYPEACHEFISRSMVWKMFLFTSPLCHCYFHNKEMWFMASLGSLKV